MVGLLPAEHPGGRAERVGHATPHHPRGPVPVRLGVPAEDRLPGHHHPAAPARPDRTGVVPDRADQLGDHLWTTEYYQLAVQRLRAQGRAIPDELLARISPAHSENVNFFGVITVDVEAELAKLSPAG